ncbi:MAG: glycyl-radical enzyme activating protein [Bacteroidales bacterium]|nr:glycyl-radical enzyme activating protein [Bacteroidales bacterium]
MHSDMSMIFNIQRFSTHDGDGIRTLIFYKGCPLQCQWCSNPESQSFGHSILYDSKSCKKFGDCTLTVPEAISRSGKKGLEIKRDLIAEPEKLKDVCASKALTLSGESKSVDELLTEVEKDLPFYREDGGVTLSGGEPLAQGEELVLLLQRLHERRISTNMETSLYVKWEMAERCIGLVGTFLVDLKHTDPVKFRHYTKGEASLVMENLERLAYYGAHVVVRIPVIPGFNHSEQEIQQMIDFVSAIKGIKEIHFLPYHTFGVEKYRMLGMEYIFDNKKQAGEEELLPYIQYAQLQGFTAKTGG